ncbi:MAG: hypothetical protein ACRC0E_11260 [Soonwooa sp.]
MKDYMLDQIIAEVKVMELTKIPIKVRESNTQRKLKNFIDGFYKDKKEVYIR